MASTLKPGLVCVLVVAAAAGAAAAIALVDRFGAGTSSRAAAGWLALCLALALGVLLGWCWQAAATASRPTAVGPQLLAAAFRQVAERFSHELNNQLGIISNSAYLVERRSQDPRLEMPVQSLLRAAECASKLGFQLQRLSGGQGTPSQTMDISHWLSSQQEMMANEPAWICMRLQGACTSVSTPERWSWQWPACSPASVSPWSRAAASA